MVYKKIFENFKVSENLIDEMGFFKSKTHIREKQNL